ncbi:hypothetical protein BJ741DRAFT_201558 [Chytriomyces cf. hyalinus JEL632]|nr:hypothetical protein BJ741DRAFT_201558 [Chytriomyces cf. hyalinus JEL632]
MGGVVLSLRRGWQRAQPCRSKTRDVVQKLWDGLLYVAGSSFNTGGLVNSGASNKGCLAPKKNCACFANQNQHSVQYVNTNSQTMTKPSPPRLNTNCANAGGTLCGAGHSSTMLDANTSSNSTSAAFKSTPKPVSSSGAGTPTSASSPSKTALLDSFASFHEQHTPPQSASPARVFTQQWSLFHPCFGAANESHLTRLPHEIAARVFLLLDRPSVLCKASRILHAQFYSDPFLLATWLVLHNQFLPSRGAEHFETCLEKEVSDEEAAAVPLIPMLKPLNAVHPLLAAMKHEARLKILEDKPDVAEMLLKIEPFVSRYELQRMYRRAITTTGSRFGSLFKCTQVIEQWSTLHFGEPVKATVPISKHQPPLQLLPQLPNTMDAANPMDIVPENNLHQQGLHLHLPDPEPQIQRIIATARPQFPLDDRRLFLDAVILGNVEMLQYLLGACALSLDPRLVADGFTRAWDRGDPFGLCAPGVGVLWPRCSASRFHVLEKLVQEEDEVVSVFLMQGGAGAAGGVPENLDLGEEIVESVVGLLKLVWEIVGEEVRPSDEDASGRFEVVRSCDVLLAAGVLGEIDAACLGEQGRMEGVQISSAQDTVYRGYKSLHPSLWSPRDSFLQRCFDLFIACGSVRSVAMLFHRYGKRVKVEPWHLTAALDRYSFPLVYLLVVYAGADIRWQEDARLGSFVKMPSDDSVVDGPLPSAAALDNAGRLCWSWALKQGAVLTERRWKGIIKLGPQSVGAVTDVLGSGFDPCRDGMLGFRVGGSGVVKVLSKIVDSFFPASKCVLFEASKGEDCRALSYCIELGKILVKAIKLGEKERVTELLDAGALVMDEGILSAGAIADMPPGDWDEWPMAARCYRRVLVQQRLGLPIPCDQTLLSLPSTVVNVAFLNALHSTRPIQHDAVAANVYSLYQRRRHPNAAGVRINLVTVLERDISVRVVERAMDDLRGLLKMCDDPAYPGEAYCFIKGMLQYGLRDKNLLRDEDEFFLPDDEWDEVASALTLPPL